MPKFSDAKPLTSDGGEWPYKTSHGGLIYFLDGRENLETFQPLEASVKESGFEHYHQLFREFLFGPFGEVFGGSLPVSTIGVIVVLPNLHAALRKVEIDGKSVHAVVEASPGVSVSDFRFVINASARLAGRFFRRRDYQQTWDPTPESSLSHEFPTPPDYAVGRLYWNPGENQYERFVDERHAERAELVHSPRLTVWQSADAGFAVLKSALDARGKQMTFEWGIASLLMLAGFDVSWLGFRESKQPQIPDVADIVAISGDDQLALIVECTLKPGDIARKISSVSEHAAKMGELLQGWQLKKAVFTTITGAGLVPCEQAARDSDVALCSQEAALALLGAVKSGVPPRQLWEQFRNDMPRNPMFG